MFLSAFGTLKNVGAFFAAETALATCFHIMGFVFSHVHILLDYLMVAIKVSIKSKHLLGKNKRENNFFHENPSPKFCPDKGRQKPRLQSCGPVSGWPGPIFTTSQVSM